MSDDENGDPFIFNLGNHAFSLQGIQNGFEGCLFTAMDRELRQEALGSYARIADRQYTAETLKKALRALEARSLAWISLPDEAAMDKKNTTVRQYVHDVEDVLAPISYAADLFNGSQYSYEGEKSVAAVYFTYMKDRLQNGVESAKSFLQNGEMVVADKNPEMIVTAFGQTVTTPATMHMFALHGSMCFNQDFLDDTRKVAEEAGMPPKKVDALVKNFARVILATRVYAKTPNDNNKSMLKRQNLVRIITEIAPAICEDIAHISAKKEQLSDEARLSVQLLGIIGANLHDLRKDVSKDR